MGFQGKTGLRGLVAAVFLGLLAACGQSNTDAPQTAADLRDKIEGPEIDIRAEKARRAEADTPERFAFLRYSSRTDETAPIACLEFSRTLKSKTDYTPYVDVKGDKQIALDVDGSSLCIGGLTFGEAVEVTLKSGLPGAGRNHALERDETFVVDFGDRPSYVGFKGDGVILPRIDADGVAIETVNVDALKISLSRVTDRALVFKEITSGFSAGRGEYYWQGGDTDPSDLAEQLWSGVVDVKSDTNQAKTTVFSIASAVERLEPGAYYIEVEETGAAGDDRPARAARWLIVTDLALTAYEGTDGLLVTARSIDTARIARDVRLDLIARNNEILKTERTDLVGQARFAAPLVRGVGPQSPRMVMAYDTNGDFAVLDLQRAPVDLSNHDINGRAASGAVESYIYTDRGIYRPGEKIQIVALLRDPSVASVANRAGSVKVYAPNGVEAGSFRFDNAQDAGAASYQFTLPKAAARGIWRIETHVDGLGVVGSERVSVEDFVPQRIALKLDADTNEPVKSGETRAITADVRFLYGAPGAGLNVEARARIERDPSPFPGFKGYSFGRHDESFREREFDLPDVTADGSGRAVLKLNPSEQYGESSFPLRLRTVVSAIEPGGRAVRDDVRIPYRTRDIYLGIEPLFDGSASMDEKARFKSVAINTDGEQVSGVVNWRLVRIDWDYDWYRTSGGEWRWRRTRNVIPVDEGQSELSANNPGEIITRELDWGDYELVLTEETSGAQASYGFWAGWGSGPQAGAEAPDRVRISAPDQPIEVGKKASYTILPPYAGEAEIVVANERIIETRTITLPEKGQKVDFNVTEEWGAGAYIMVSVYTPRDPVARPRPRRAVGVSHAPIDVSARTFEISLNAPSLIKPREKLKLELATEDGPRGEFVFATVAAVDEGILQLTKFSSPNPADFFFAKRKLGVELKDDYGRLLDPNQGAAAKPRTGGDQIGGAGLSVVPTKTIALFSGIVPLGRDGTAEVELDIPDFNGELRLMAVAWSNTGLGAVAQPLTVRDDVPAQIILPRFLAPGDTAVATVTLDNVDGLPGQYDADVSNGDSVKIEQPVVTAILKKGERADLGVEITAEKAGVTDIGLQVSGPNHFMVERDYDIEIRSPYLPLNRVTRVVLEPGESWTAPENVLAGFVPGSAELTVSASPLPMDAAALYESLSRYPYGCTEQTVSRAMPLLYAENMAKIAGIKADDQIRTRVQEAVSTILNRQGADGAIGLWRMGDRQASPWLGAYAVDFLARAKSQGYVVPQEALDKAYNALGHVAERKQMWSVGYETHVYTSRWNSDTEELLMSRSSAYAGYVLARAGKIDASRLRYIHDEQLKNTPSPLARAHIAAAMSFIGDNARTNSALNKAKEALGYENSGDYYQTRRRDLAGVLALAAEIGDTETVRALTDQVMEDLPEPDRLTTQEKGFLLLAANALSSGATKAKLSLSGSASVVADNKLYVAHEADLLPIGNTTEGEEASTVQLPDFTNAGDGQVWLTAVAHGAPVSAPPADSEGFLVRKELYSVNGTAVSASSVMQGDQIIVQLSVRPRDRQEHPIIVADLLPAGFEIEAILTPSTSGPYDGFLDDLSYADIAEARDDRFIASVDVRDSEWAHFAYVVRAVTPGDFAMPGVVVEDMYRPTVFGRTQAGRVTIRPAQ